MNKRYESVKEIKECWDAFYNQLSLKSKIAIIAYFFLEILRRFSTILLPSILIFFAQKVKINMNFYSSIFILSLVFICGLTYYSGLLNINSEQSSFLFRYHLIPKIGEKVLHMNYETLESYEGQLKIDRAYEAVYNGNFAGVEFIINRCITFFILSFEVLCFIVFSVTVDYLSTILVVGINIFLLVLQKQNKKWIITNKKTKDYVQQKQNYLARQLQHPENANEMAFYPIRTWFSNCFDNYACDQSKWEKAYQRRLLFTELLDIILLFCCNGIIMYSAFMMLIKHTSSLEKITSYINILLSLGGVLANFVTTCNELQTNGIHLKALKDYFDIDDCLEAKIQEEINSIEFRNVSYKNPASNCTLVSDISFIANKGDKIAIVGENGSGKTTFIKLICGLYSPTEGSILINGIDSERFSLLDRYNMCSAVFQEGVTYSFSIAENISCRSLDSTDMNKVYDCLIASGLCQTKKEAEVFSLKQIGYELGDGIQLSGGQQQKMYIARMMYDLRQCLVLDEPTASLDPISESEIYKLYDKIATDKISFFVSHRLGSTKFCNKIICMKEGHIVEIGTHAELVKRKGFYYELYMRQKEKYRTN